MAGSPFCSLLCGLAPLQQNNTPHKSKPCQWAGEELSGKVENGGLTASLVKESSEPHVHFKRADFRGKRWSRFSWCGPVLQNCAGHTLEPNNCKMLKLLSEHNRRRKKKKVYLRKWTPTFLSYTASKSHTYKRCN